MKTKEFTKKSLISTIRTQRHFNKKKETEDQIITLMRCRLRKRALKIGWLKKDFWIWPQILQTSLITKTEKATPFNILTTIGEKL